ncbi:Alcohol Dehydrogenase 1C, partial [Manis pentadactyla]
MDMTPTPLDIIFRSPPTQHEAEGSTIAGHLCSSDEHHAGGRRLVSLAPYDAMGGTADGLEPTPNSASEL